MQETFQAVYRSLDRFEREKPGAFRGWLWTIARNKMRDAARQNVPDAEGGSTANQRWQDLPEPEPDDQSISGERKSSILFRAIDLVKDDFTESTWKAFCGVMIEQKTVREVADALGMSTGAVYQARARVLHRLHEELGDVVSLA